MKNFDRHFFKRDENFFLNVKYLKKINNNFFFQKKNENDFYVFEKY